MKKILCFLLCCSVIICSGCSKAPSPNDNTQSLISADSSEIAETDSVTNTSSSKKQTSTSSVTSSLKKPSQESSSKYNSTQSKPYSEASSTVSKTQNNSGGTAMTTFTDYVSLLFADLKIGDKVFVDIKPYIYGNFKITEDVGFENGYSVLDLGDKSAVRFYDTHNSWQEKFKPGSLISHKGFTGYCDFETLSKKPCVNGTYPANTLESVEHAIRLGYKIIEVDISVTGDGTWVLAHETNTIFHEPTSRPLRNLTYSELKAMPIYRNWKGGGCWEFSEHIATEYTPTLDEVLALCAKNDVFIYLDAKWVNNYDYTEKEMDDLAQMIRKHKMERRCAAYGACLTPLIKRIPEIIAAFSSMPAKDEKTSALLLSTYENYVIDIPHIKINEFASFTKKYNVPLTIWLSDDYREIDNIFSLGADYVMTDFCLENPNLSDYKTIHSFNFDDFAKKGKDYSLLLSFKNLGLHPGDMVVLSAKSSDTAKDGAYLRVATESSPTVRFAERELKNCDNICYVVNDKFEYDITASVITNGMNITDLSLEILRESARGEK